jgi:hypothetical protein
MSDVWPGESVGEQYSSLREQAIEHARVRNKLFQEATQAYLVGNKSTATQLSAQYALSTPSSRPPTTRTHACTSI